MMRLITVGLVVGTLGFAAACGGGAQQNTSSTGDVAPMASPAASGSAATTAGGADVTLKTEPDPPQVGENRFEAMVMANGQPVTDGDVSIEFLTPGMPSMNMPEMRSTVSLKHESSGRYVGAGKVAMAGRWDATVKVRRDAQEVGSRTFTVTAR